MKGFLLFLLVVVVWCGAVLADELRIIDLDDWFPDTSSYDFDMTVHGYTWQRSLGPGDSDIERIFRSTTDVNFFEIDVEGTVRDFGKVRIGLFHAYRIP